MPSGTLERNNNNNNNNNTTSSKPIMEKRRRARINESLGQLKTLILDALKKDSSRHSKLEKADILEMTVKHLRNLQRLHITDPLVVGKYRAGFSECVGEVTRFLSACEGVTTEVRTRLLAHLAACVTPHQVNYGPQPHTASPAPQPQSCKGNSPVHVPVHVSSDAMTAYGGFQVVPTPDGHVVFVVQSAAITPLPAQSSGHMSLVAPPLTSDSVWRPW
uniref:Transcription factor HES-1-B-like n=1 Tax=Gouania willdenowi TaxID=441366 RepID=A0A8C5DFR9_GOUWI